MARPLLVIQFRAVAGNSVEPNIGLDYAAVPGMKTHRAVVGTLAPQFITMLTGLQEQPLDIIA